MEKNQFNTIISRLTDHFIPETRKQMCEKYIKVPMGTFDTWRSRGKISSRGINRIAKNTGLSKQWILHGIGEKYGKESEGAA